MITDVYDGERYHLTLPSPIAWDIIEGELSYENKTFTTKDSPLLVMAHSPPGEAEGEVLPIFSEEDFEKAEGKIVLVGEKWRDYYKKANEAGAKAFIAYRKGTGNAFPYIGLFLTKKDLEWAKIPALTVPESVASDMIGKAKKGGVRVKVRVETKILTKRDLPIVYAKIGEPPYVLFSAHICHPKPGANDNASGSAMLIELARILSKVEGRVGFAFLWIPEYHGTQAFIPKVKTEEFYANINLDMVGGSEDRANSTIMLVRTPLSRFSIISGIAEMFIEKYNSGGSSFSGSPLPRMKFKAYPYEMGSDHDIFNIFSVPGIMPITWPDNYYHTSADTPEKLSLESLSIIGKAVLSTAIFLAKAEKDELERVARGYTMKYLGELGVERKIEVAESFVMDGLARDSKFLGLNMGHELEEDGWIVWKDRGIISTKKIEYINEKLANRLKDIYEDGRMTIVHIHEFLMLSERVKEEKAWKALRDEYGKIKEDRVKEAVKILEELNIISPM
ncbi:putative leucine aminopeptidase [Pyrococcus sp. ST04]|nr:putative leucine aminopeptidase [Pyrococcus sp. ST04]